MNPEYLLDAMGLLDDDLIREAEEYVPQRHRPRYGAWLGLAACLAVVLTLRYGLPRLAMGGGGAKGELSGGAGAPDASEPAAPSGEENLWTSQGAASAPVPGDAPDIDAPSSPAEPDASNSGGGAPGDWLCALRVDGMIYRDTGEYIKLEPAEDEVRYTASFLDTWEPEEDGQANFEPVGTPYVVLDNGKVAVLWNEDTGSWRVFDSVPPWEK